jgi:hypothetical protein
MNSESFRAQVGAVDAHCVNERLFTFRRKLLTYRATADNDNVTRYRLTINS